MDSDQIALRYSQADGGNKDLIDLTADFMGRDNADFFAEVSRQIKLTDEADLNLKDGRTFKNGLKIAIGLIGEYGLIGYGIRQAQSIIRFDKQPSYWSHSFLFFDPVPESAEEILSTDAKAPMIWESTMDLSGPLPQLHMINGVSPRYLRDYNKSNFDLFSHHCVPNVGVLVFALTADEVEKILKRVTDPNIDQLRYDFSGLIGTWLAYVLNRQNEANPLGAGKAIYCSAFCQLAYEAIGLDLGIGAHTRNTSPELIWQGAKWFYDILAKGGYPVRGYFCVRDPRCEMIPAPTKINLSLKAGVDSLRSA